MTPRNELPEENELPEDLEPAADWVRAQRPEVTGHDLDRVRQRAHAQAMRPGRSGSALARPRRAFSTAVTVLALAVGLGGAFAIAGKGPPSSPPGQSQGSAADKQYLPGKGCGDKNHTHTGGAPPSHSNGQGTGNQGKDPDETDCKKPPK